MAVHRGLFEMTRQTETCVFPFRIGYLRLIDDPPVLWANLQGQILQVTLHWV